MYVYNIYVCMYTRRDYYILVVVVQYIGLVVGLLLITDSSRYACSTCPFTYQNEFSPGRRAKESSHDYSSRDGLSLWTRATALFRRVPILGALCGEVLICQCLSSLLSFMFMMCYKETLQADEERASYIGKVSILSL
jgi:hypothetical protein